MSSRASADATSSGAPPCPSGGGGQRIKSLAPKRSLAFFWTIEENPTWALEWRVEKEGAESRLRLVHSGFGADDEECLFFGWAAFLMAIALYLETGRPVQESGRLLIEHEAWCLNPSSKFEIRSSQSQPPKRKDKDE